MIAYVEENIKQMKDVEIVVFNDKSWVRLTEYQKLDEELKQEKQSLAKRIYELQSDLSRVKTDLEYAKAIIKDLLNNSHEYSRQNAEDFIKGDNK